MTPAPDPGLPDTELADLAVRVRAAQGREPGAQGGGRDRGVLDRHARHQDVGDPPRVRDLDRSRPDPGLGQDGVIWGLAQDRGQHREAGLADEDHLIATLKARGIYVALELQSARRYRSDDGVADVDLLPLGGGPAAFFDPGLP